MDSWMVSLVNNFKGPKIDRMIQPSRLDIPSSYIVNHHAIVDTYTCVRLFRHKYKQLLSKT